MEESMALNTVNLDDFTGQSITGLESPYIDFNFFNRPPNWANSFHQHRYFQFLLVLSGELLVCTESEEKLLGRGMASLIPPGFSHSLKTSGGYRQFGINLNATGGEEEVTIVKLLNTYIKTPCTINRSELLDLIPEIEDCILAQTMVSLLKIRNRLEYILLTCVNILQKRDGIQDFREKMISLLGDKLSEPLSLSDLSRHLSMSQTTIERLSYREFGCGAIKLFNRLKINQARMLLINTDLLVSQISDQLGYYDQAYFSKIFKKYVGVSPHVYKRERRP
jgi:AraC-like DNA-binding protein